MNSQNTIYRTKHTYRQADQINFTRTNLFFIKSKHVFKNYKNHQYFEVKANHRIQQPDFKEFVSYPVSFGINNAYKYLCQQTASNNIRKNRFTSQKIQTQGQNLLKSTAKQSFVAQKRSRAHYTLPNLAQNAAKIEVKMVYEQQNERAENVRAAESEQRESEEIMDVVFVHRGKKTGEQQKYSRYELKMNMYNNIVSTFAKSRINYKQLSRQQFALIKKKIIEIFSSEKETIEYKDIVNLKSVKDIFRLIEERDDPVFTKQTLRYFFVSSVQVYQYQLQKMKDQLKNLVNYQFQQEISQQDIYIYNSQGKEMNHLEQIMAFNQHPFICGIHKNVHQLFVKERNQNSNKRNMINRINKWKSAVPSAPHEQRVSFRLPTSLLNDSKYNTLFQTVKKKHNGSKHGKKRSVISLKSSQFIDKDKLCKQQNIFQ